MNRWTLVPLLMAVLAAAPARAVEKEASAAEPGPMRMGLSLGVASPFGGGGSDETFRTAPPSLALGFQADLPLLRTLHLAPSAALYRFKRLAASDVGLAFKLVLPLPAFDLYAGFEPGLTSVGEHLTVYGGALLGFSLPMVSNLDAFVESRFKFIALTETGTQVLHVGAGALYRF